MGFKAYRKDDVIVGENGYVKLELPDLGFRYPIWCRLKMLGESDEEMIVSRFLVDFLGWDCNTNFLPNHCLLDDVKPEQIKLLKTTLDEVELEIFEETYGKID